MTITYEISDAQRQEMLNGAVNELKLALTKLSNEVLACLPLIELQARQDMGNTNYAILMERAQEAKDLVAKIEGRWGLIAAAPDMLVILRRIRDSYPGYIPDFIEAVNAIIVKIEGRP